MHAASCHALNSDLKGDFDALVSVLKLDLAFHQHML